MRSARRQSFDPLRRAFAYTTGALEPVCWLADRGVPTVVCQIDPGRVEAQIVADEEQRWPGWSNGADSIPDEYFCRLEEEWRAADVVMVNSEWSKHALEQQGVPAGKLRVVPLAYETPQSNAMTKRVGKSSHDWQALRLTVLWLGQVILRKGIAYLRSHPHAAT